MDERDVTIQTDDGVAPAAQVRAPDPLFATGDGELCGLWDRLLSLQAELFFPTEALVISAFDAWQRADTVVDVGTGNGAWLGRLAAAAPAKDFLGLDPSPELIGIAAERHAGPNLRFAAGDWRDVAGPVDLLVLRMVLQHLADYDLVLHALASRLADGGALLVIDNDPAAARTWPETPATAGVYAAIARQQRRKHDTDADYLGAFVRAVGARRDMTLALDRVVVVRSIDAENTPRFQEQTRLALQLFRAAGEVRVNFDAAIDEWDEWCDEPRRYAQLGLRFLLVTRA